MEEGSPHVSKGSMVPIEGTEEDMNKLESKHGALTADLISEREENGVRIFERETKRLVFPTICREKHEPKPSTTQLVIDDAVSRSKDFIARRRSELGEVDSLLKSLINHPISVK